MNPSVVFVLALFTIPSLIVPAFSDRQSLRRAEPQALGMAYFYVGWSYSNIGLWDEAIEVYHRALERTEDLEQQRRIWMEIGIAHLQQGRWRKARRAAQKGFDPAEAEALRACGGPMRSCGGAIPTDPEEIRALQEEAERLEAELRALEEAQEKGDSQN